MQQTLTLRVLPSEAADAATIRRYIAQSAAVPVASITGFHLLKKSIDARGKTAWINLGLRAFIDEPFTERPHMHITLQEVHHAKHTVIIIGAGPAGLFAALRLIELGIQPILIERGKDVRARRRDLAQLNKEGIVNPESNYCFGEGGAGTYSDGKLYTRSTKRGDINRILHILVQFGATDTILYEAHPHIGTNKLPHIITAMRQQIIDCGGQVHFDTKAVDLQLANDRISGIITQHGDTIAADAVILATGHSARDIFRLLHHKQLLIEAKPFALGVRAEHPQALIDSTQYHCAIRDSHLPPASYSLVEQVNNRGVFSFCMCPGGIIAPAATNPGELVVNGWSPSKRNNPFANSGMVVQVDLKDAYHFLAQPGLKQTYRPDAGDPLLLMNFQQHVETTAFAAGGGRFTAPAQRMVDFCSNIPSSALPGCSYLPGVASAPLKEVLPGFIYTTLQQGFRAFGKKMRGYYTNDALLVATESRTSSPVRIPRDPAALHHPQVRNLYPCGEGAGYAGGIVSAAMDGEKVASQVAVALAQ